MKFNFDEVIDRKGTKCLKWDLYPKIFKHDDLLPLWIADMDFRAPDFVIEALRKRLEHEVLGYTGYCDCWYKAIEGWLLQRFGWEPGREALTFIPGIVRGIAYVIHCFTKEGDRIMMTPPVYNPFFNVTASTKREVVFSPLEEREGRFYINWDDFEQKIQGCKLFILCHPHNPGGRVWSKEELCRIADICEKAGVVVISDEIHADLTHAPLQHIPFATTCEAAARISITFMAPSKAFNIAGLASSYAVVVNEALRQKFFDFLMASGFAEGNLFSYEGLIAAYTHGEEWLNAVKRYIVENIDFVDAFLHREIPEIKIMRPEASFLVFLDCRSLGLTTEELAKLFTDKAHLALNTGASFGPGGEGYMRLNVGAPRSIIEKALVQLREAIHPQA